MEKLVSSLKEPVSRKEFADPGKRGKYLVTLGECVACHTSHAEYNPGLFGGGNFIERFGLKAFSANITKSPAGMDYGPVGFLSVMHTGKGGTLSPIMPWVAFKNISDDDLNAIYAYIATMPTSSHYVTNQLPFTQCAICGMEHGLGKKNKR
jgi:mono/diheme cytochrome c family protein